MLPRALVPALAAAIAIAAPLTGQARPWTLTDAASVEFTRNPRALLRALERIAETESPLRNASRGTAHLFIVNPLQGAREDDEGFFDNLFSTHPPLKRRIERLRALLHEASGETPPAAGAATAASTTRG